MGYVFPVGFRRLSIATQLGVCYFGGGSLPGKGGFMSTLINFSIFPLDKGESVSMYVARALKIVRDSGLAYKLNSMGTTIEGEWDEVMDVVSRCFEEIKKNCDRVYMTVNADYRKGKSRRIDSKVKSVESKLTTL